MGDLRLLWRLRARHDAAVLGTMLPSLVENAHAARKLVYTTAARMAIRQGDPNSAPRVKRRERA